MSEMDTKIMDEEIIGEVESELKLLEFSQKMIVDSIKNRTILLVDLTMNENKDILKLAYDRLKKHQLLLKYYLSKFEVEDGLSASKVFQFFLGPDVNFKVISVSKFPPRVPPGTEFAFVIFSGSPANVTDALTSCKDGKRNNHQLVYEFASELYNFAVDYDLPIFGTCYGHQFLSHKNGNIILNKGSFTAGKISKTISKKISHILKGNNTVNERGFIPYYNGEVVKGYNNAYPIFETDVTLDENINDGSIFFTGDNSSDLSQFLDFDFRWSLGLQGHPEYSIFEPIFSAAWATKEITPLGQRSLGSDILELLAHLINLRGMS
jgi:hypothetical protein